MKAKLKIALVPSTCWFSNIRSGFPAEWETIRRQVYRKANYRCQVCGGKGPRHPVEAHELWRYRRGVQKLVRIVALCPACHQVKHIGLAFTNGKHAEALTHLAKVNGWSMKQTKDYVIRCFALWEKRSKRKWTLDISHLSKYGVDVKNRPLPKRETNLDELDDAFGQLFF